ncbi:MAG: discoidin domain-containing protein [Granulosicoccus sp.]
MKFLQMDKQTAPARKRTSVERFAITALLAAAYSFSPASAMAATSESSVLDRSEWEVSASNNDWDAKRAIDSAIDTRWTSTQPQQPGQTFTINMKESKLVDTIKMATNNNSAFNADHPRGYEVHLSGDGINWGDAVASGSGNTSGNTDINFTRQSAQFIRITQTGGDAFYWWSIHEIVVLGGDNENVANVAPTAGFSLPTPADNSTLLPGTEINLSVDADDSDGFVEKVSMFIGDQLVGERDLPPYEWSSELDSALADLAEGSYTLRAEVTDNTGAVTTVSSSFVINASELIAGIRHPDIVNMLNIRVSNIPYGPDAMWWGDSYSVGDQCFCDTTFDHDIDEVSVDTQLGEMTVREACDLIGDGPGSEGRPRYNDVQCGNGPVNGQPDEDFCPGQINAPGTTDERRLACNNVGPKWNFDAIDPVDIVEPVQHPDIVSVLDTPLEDIPYAPDPIWWGDSYSADGQCFCDTTFDHEIGDVLVDTPAGTMDVKSACALAGDGPGITDDSPRYNDVQCGNGPVNGTVDEAFCPGQINVEGTDEQRRLGCNNIGPKWSIEAATVQPVPVESAELHPDIVTVLDTPLSDIPYGPDPIWWGDSYSVDGQCYCDTTYDHDIADVAVETPLGTLTVKQACELVGEGPGIIEGVTPRYNDVQCGNGPVNGTVDEAFCPGQINMEGTDEQRRLGCNNIGPTWQF